LGEKLTDEEVDELMKGVQTGKYVFFLFPNEKKKKKNCWSNQTKHQKRQFPKLLLGVSIVLTKHSHISFQRWKRRLRKICPEHSTAMSTARPPLFYDMLYLTVPEQSLRL
jgi:hypothetical protein